MRWWRGARARGWGLNDACECSALTTHAFRNPDDLIHAVRLAAEEVDRGVLERLGAEVAGAAEQEALASVLACGALPNLVRYRFACTVCGERFTLCADADEGRGGWVREGDAGP